MLVYSMPVMSMDKNEKLHIHNVRNGNFIEKSIIENGETIAFVDYRIDPDNKIIIINWMRTEPGWRRKGWAKLLVDRVSEEAESNGFNSVEASTDGDSKTVRRVFERCGFNMVKCEPCGGSKKTMIYYQNSQ